MNNLTGIVLCGGKSCRFGEDKGLCTLGGKRMIDYPLEALKGVCNEIIISSNDDRYYKLGYKVISDQVKGIGPLGGIYTALLESKTDDNIIISCDMPFVNNTLLKYILDNRGKALIASAFEGKYVEPLCSYYSKNIIPFIEEMIKNKRFKLQRLLKKTNYKKIVIDDNLQFYNKHFFLNINTQTEYNKAVNILKETS